MTTYVTDTFTGTPGALLTTRSGELGATWARMSSFTSGATPGIDDTGGRLFARDGANAVLYSSGVAPADGEQVSLAFDVLTAVGQIGVGTRCQSNAGYFARITGGVATIIRINGSSTMTPLNLDQGGMSVPLVLTEGSHTLAITATGTDASVRLEASFDGAPLIGATDTSAERLNALGAAGLQMGLVLGSATTGIHPNSISGQAEVEAGTTTFSLSEPKDGRVFQRQSGKANVTVSGAWAGVNPASIQARLVPDGSQSAVPGFDWRTVVATPAGAAFSFFLADVPQGGWYNLQLRDGAAPEAVFTSGVFGVGAQFATAGQSNIHRWFRAGDGALAPSPMLRVHGNIGTWVAPNPASMSGAIAFGNAMVESLGVPVAVLDYAWDGSGLIVSNLGGQWVPATSSAYVPFKNGVTAAGGKLEGLVWIQGETEAKLLPGQQTYYDGLTSLFSNIRSDLQQPTLPVVLALLARRTSGAAPDADTESIRRAQVQKTQDANIYRIERMDLSLSDGVHHTAQGNATVGQRCAAAMQFALGRVSQYRGPRVTAVEKISSTQVDLTIAHASGNDFGPTTGITGFRVTDRATGSEIANTGARVAANKIRLTLAAATAGSVDVQHLYGNVPNITGIAKDNSALALPLEYSPLIQAADVGEQQDTSPPVMAGSISITAITASGAQASWPTASDNSAVAGYEHSLNGTVWTDLGMGRAASLSGLVAETEYTIFVRAYDAAGNLATPLSRRFTTAEATPPGQGDFDASKVSAARKVVFPGGTRVVAFGSAPSAAVPGGPFYEDGKWCIRKHVLDEFYCVGDISIDLAESNTGAMTVEAIVQGVTLLEQPVIQGHLVPVKLGGLDIADGALNFCTLRVTYENSEQVDFTIWFVENRDFWTLNKDPDDKRFYVADVANILADSNTQIQTALDGIPVGVTVLEQPTIQGALLAVKLGGLDVAPGAINACTLPFACANGEKFFRTIQFSRVDN